MKKIPVPPQPENTLIIVWTREPGDGWIGSVLGEPLYRLWYDREGTGRWQLGYRTAVEPPEWGPIQSQWRNREWSRGRAERHLKEFALGHFMRAVVPKLVEQMRAMTDPSVPDTIHAGDGPVSVSGAPSELPSANEAGGSTPPGHMLCTRQVMWSSNPPTKPGWYWCRDTDQVEPQIHKGQPFIAQVDGHGWTADVWPSSGERLQDYPTLQWAGPIEPPPFTK